MWINACCAKLKASFVNFVKVMRSSFPLSCLNAGDVKNVKPAITKAASAPITVQSVNAYGRGEIKWPDKALNLTTLNPKRRRRYRRESLTLLNREGDRGRRPKCTFIPWASIGCHIPQQLGVLQQNSFRYHGSSTKIILLVTAHFLHLFQNLVLSLLVGMHRYHFVRPSTSTISFL